MTRYNHGWPVLESQRAAELLDKTPDPEALKSLADKITVYPGGGAAAHRLREAATLIDSARNYLSEQVT